MSLRRHLLVVLMTALTAIWLGVGSLAYVYMRYEVDELFDHQLEQVGATLQVMDIQHHDDSIQGLPGASHDDDRFVVYRWDAHGRLRYASPGAPEVPFRARSRMHDLEGERGDWRLWQFFSEPQQSWIAVGRELHERDELLTGFLLGLMLPWLFSLMLVIWLVWWVINKVMGRLALVSDEISRRRMDDLIPVPLEYVPVEVLPMVTELNYLLERLRAALQNERRFTADAAHELRTPLAAIRVQAESALMSQNMAVREAALQQVVQSVERAGHTISQLLQLARLDSQTALTDVQSVDLCEVLRGVMAELTQSALARKIELELRTDHVAITKCQPELMRIALNNLVANAVEHAKGCVLAQVQLNDTQVVCRIQDDGEGVPADQLPLLGERFHRVNPGRPGSGLGLSITRQIVGLHRGEVTFANLAHGLEVTVVLPIVV